jgi:hypothetical protein
MPDIVPTRRCGLLDLQRIGDDVLHQEQIDLPQILVPVVVERRPPAGVPVVLEMNA